MSVEVQEMIPLELLREGETGRVVDVIGPEAWVHRLKELGVREGALVRMVKSGEPLILAIQGHRLSFRADPTTTVFVEVESASNSPE